MEEKKEYLNEDWYQKVKKKITRTALFIFLIGLLLGGTIITIGIIKTNNIKMENDIKLNEKINSIRTEEQIQADIDAIQEKIDTTLKEQDNLEIEQEKIFRDQGYSDSYYEKQKEIQLKSSELKKLYDQQDIYEKELFDVQTTSKDELKFTNALSNSRYIFLYILGGIIIISAAGISLMVYVVAKRREIMAFSTQQVMPVAQEGIEKMAPTVGNAVKEITKGIKDGLDDKE